MTIHDVTILYPQLQIYSKIIQTSASAGLQDAYPTIRPYAMLPPPIPNAQRPSQQLGNTPDAMQAASPTYAAAPVTTREPIFTKREDLSG